jgi:hypothetical protein
VGWREEEVLAWERYVLPSVDYMEERIIYDDWHVKLNLDVAQK